MNLRSVLIAAWRCSVAALIIWGGSILAQQPIQFSKPANEDPAATANSFLPGAGHAPPSAYNAPNPLFGGNPGSSFDTLPMGPQPIILNVNRQAQKAAQQRKNWTYLTPEEILAIPTPESILHIPDPQDDPKLSPEQRYLNRRDQQARFAATNATLRVDALSWQSPNSSDRVFGSLDSNNNDRDRSAKGTSDSSGNSLLGPGGSRNPNSPFNQNSLFQNSGPDADRYQRQNSSWMSPFDSPGPLPKPSPEQQAGMERFRAQFLEAPPVPAPVATTFDAPQSPAPDPYMNTMPAFNPAGSSFKSLESDIAKPVGLTPLSGVTGPRPAAPKPAPLVQPPPWLSAPSPQNGNVPHRVF